MNEQIADLEALDDGDGLAEAMRMAIEAGMLVDSGQRRNGRILWERTSKKVQDWGPIRRARVSK
jgi:hypothetical protein